MSTFVAGLGRHVVLRAFTNVEIFASPLTAVRYRVSCDERAQVTVVANARAGMELRAIALCGEEEPSLLVLRATSE
jgi:hypothetical protein